MEITLSNVTEIRLGVVEDGFRELFIRYGKNQSVEILLYARDEDNLTVRRSASMFPSMDEEASPSGMTGSEYDELRASDERQRAADIKAEMRGRG